MQTFWYDQKETYTGTQLTPLTNYLRHGVLGDSIVSWQGPCQVALEHMMDGEDLRVKSAIASDQMLHFVIELFHFPLSSAVCLQRLMGEILILKLQQFAGRPLVIRRSGDDLYWEKKKLNVSIATCSQTSSLIHYGINVGNEGTPVETCALTDFGITDVPQFARAFMDACKDEVMSLRRAVVKVRTF